MIEASQAYKEGAEAENKRLQQIFSEHIEILELWDAKREFLKELACGTSLSPYAVAERLAHFVVVSEALQ